MIRIACTNCKTVLSIDDAFAGGVCRCQHCGTIQTVPAKARGAAAASTTTVTAGSKALFQHNPKSDGASSGTGLDELAGIVASSGLSGSGLRSRRLTTPASGPGSRRNLAAIFITVAAVIVVLLGVIAWLSMHHGTANASANGSAPSLLPTAPIATGPNFCGVSITGSSVIYLLDRGSGNREIFAAMTDATLKSITSLGPDRKFQILFWSNGSDEAGYPQGSTTYATTENIEAAKLAIRDVSAFGASDIKSAMQKALSNSPDVILIATAKGPLLDDSWTSDLLNMRGSSTTKIDTLSLGSASSSEALKNLATKTGGEYREVGDADLRSFAGS
jgi:hypothetical protein